MSNHARAKILAPIFKAILIDDVNISRKVLNNVDGTGLNVYRYLQKTYPFNLDFATDEADRVMRHVSARFIDDIDGSLTTSVIGARRDRIFYDTEFPRIGREAVDLITGIAKSKQIEIVNDGSVLDIRKLFKHHAIDLAYRVVCVNEIDKLDCMAWELFALPIMQHCLDVEEIYMVDRQKMWLKAAKEIFGGKIRVSELVNLDRKPNMEDRAKKRSMGYCGTPADRLSQKERKFFHFVVAVVAQKALPEPSPLIEVVKTTNTALTRYTR